MKIVETSSEIRQRMLKNAPSDIDKREGSIFYDSVSSVAIELELIKNAIEWTFQNSFADTAERPFLIERGKERGISPKQATSAIVKAEFLPLTVDVPINTRCSSDDVIYKVVEKLSDNNYLLSAEQVGKVGNKSNGNLIFIDYIKDIKSGRIIELSIPAVDEESTEEFRKDYFDTFDNRAFGGNIADYKKKMKEYSGVGGVKVYPVWNGGGTVKVVFSTSEHTPPTSEFVKKVQEFIDPVLFNQKGVGNAPIGHMVTVQGVGEDNINVSFILTLKSGITYEQIQDKVKKVINDYLKSINAEWEKTQVASALEFADYGLVVRLSYIESLILDIPEVIDVENTRINGNAKNYKLSEQALAVLGVVSNE